jgi:hypothetical protein
MMHDMALPADALGMMMDGWKLMELQGFKSCYCIPV